MLQSEKFILAQLNAMIETKEREGIKTGTLKVNQAALLFILIKYKTDTFRGFKLSCEK